MNARQSGRREWRIIGDHHRDLAVAVEFANLRATRGPDHSRRNRRADLNFVRALEQEQPFETLVELKQIGMWALLAQDLARQRKSALPNPRVMERPHDRPAELRIRSHHLVVLESGDDAAG